VEVCFESRGNERIYFQGQRPVLDFIVDFIFIPLRLIIEVDGYSHLVHPQPPPAGDIGIAKVSAKKDIISSEDQNI
jgi:hypothetical protein